MRSRADTLRVGLERVLRVITLLLIVLAAWSSIRPVRERAADVTDSADLRESLARWTGAPPRAAEVSLEIAPEATERDWLRALRRAGTPVTWRGDSIPPIALECALVADPRGGTSIWAVAPTGSRMALADAIAPIDTLVASAGGAMVVAPMTAGALRATLGAHHAAAAVSDSLLLRRVLVLARATWESRFIVSALEEAGWLVDARLTVAPGVEIRQGARGHPDTAHHTALVVVDVPVATPASAITRYVRSGGGLILAGAAASAPAMIDIAAGGTGARIRPLSIAFAEDGPRRALAFREIRPRQDAILLEARDGRVAAAARRVEAGRVVQIGYEDTWRWRLGGGTQAVAAHGAWWSGLVSSVAYRATVPRPGFEDHNDAPLARLIDAWGEPTTPPIRPVDRRWFPSPLVLFLLISGLLLVELASRRLRGAP